MKIFFIFLLCIVTPLSAQWEWKGNGIPYYNKQGDALDAYDSLNAVIAVLPAVPPQDHNLFITTDGGTTWTGSGPQKWIIDVSMTSPMKIWFVTGSNEIWRTSDGGLNWEMLLTADTLTSFFNYIKMFDDSTGIVMGDALRSRPALFLRTTDAGDTWFSVNDNYFIDVVSSDTWRRISFPGSNTGYFIPPSRKLFKTTDGGYNWSEDTSIDQLILVNFYNDNYGMCFRMNCDSVGNFILRTTNGGVSWDSIFIFNDLSIMPTRGYGIDFEFLTDDPSKVWFAVQDTLYFSSDSGSTWQKDNLSESFTFARDLKIVDGKVCWFLCETVYRNLNADVLISAEENIPEIPAAFTLYQNYPNPFNPYTKIKYSITEPCFVMLTVYDIIGREIEVLQDGYLDAGVHSTEFNSENLPSGVYIYILKAGEYVQSRKMLLLK